MDSTGPCISQTWHSGGQAQNLGRASEMAAFQKVFKFAFPPARGVSTTNWTWKGEHLLFNFAVAIVID